MKPWRALIRAYYGRDAAHRYFDGVSDGGHEALDLAQRFPADFDGIIAGAPANNWSALAGLFEPWLGRVNLDRHDHQILTAEKLPALHAAVVRACADAAGVIADPRACTFQPSSLRCPGTTDAPSCLTPAKIDVVRAFYRGPTDRHGVNLFDGGMPYGSELAWQVWALQPAADTAAPGDTVATGLGLNYLRNAAYWHNPLVTLGLRDVPFTAAAHEALQEVGDIYDATNPDLRPFAARGGKLIVYHGWADQGIPPFETVDYYGPLVRRLCRNPAVLPPLHDPWAVPLPLRPARRRRPGHGGRHDDAAGPLGPRRRRARRAQPPTDGSPVVVAPSDPTRPAPRNDGLNSNYHYVGHDSTYRPGTALWCRQDGMTLRCTRH